MTSTMDKLPKLRCDECDNGIEIGWFYCPWCGKKTADGETFQCGDQSVTESYCDAVAQLKREGKGGVPLWVIERANSDPAAPKYWCAHNFDATRMIAWTSYHEYAIRFARKWDAEQVAQAVMPQVHVRICAHIWE